MLEKGITDRMIDKPLRKLKVMKLHLRWEKIVIPLL